MKHLFLRGPIGSGKSSLIREAIMPYLPRVGGFYVQRLFLDDRCRAFSLNPVTIPKEYSLNKKVQRIEEAEKVFLYCGDNEQWRFKLDVFEIFGVLYLSRSSGQGKKLILLDEVGGIDLQCHPFLQALLDTLDGEIPCLGVLKADINSRKLDNHLADKSNNSTTIKPFLQKLIDHPEVKLLNFQPETSELIKRQVHGFVKEAVAE